MVHNRSQPSHNKSIVYGAGGHLVTSSAFLKRSPCLLWHTTNNLHVCTMITFSTLKFAPKTVLNRRQHWWYQHWRVCSSYLGAGVLLLQMLLCQIGPEAQLVSFKCVCWTRTERCVLRLLMWWQDTLIPYLSNGCFGSSHPRIAQS